MQAKALKKYSNSTGESYSSNVPLRICILTYRGNPSSGGQGVYVRRISRSLKDLGHSVDVVAGQPYPILDEDIVLHKLPSLDLYNPDALFRTPRISELRSPVNLLEWILLSSGGFPEPFTFSLRAYEFLKKNKDRYDVVHDNQCLAYGMLGIKRLLPLVTTIHHPITKDRDIEVDAQLNILRKIQKWRWYSFLGMQKRVARKLGHLITVSEASKKDISLDFKIDATNFNVVPNGINTEIFYPIPGNIRPENRLIVTNSADTPLKGLKYLLQAVDRLRRKRDIHLTVIGKPKPGGAIERQVKDLNLKDAVTFTGRIDEGEFASYYANSTIAVVPSIYEGFGLPAGEAMACAVPVISTTGGALPEVVGNAGLLVPPGDDLALEKAIITLLDNPGKCHELAKTGYERVIRKFTWKNTALATMDVYKEAIYAYS
jgi:glycosyltransferase involved in cell wall biosynthesis